MKYLLCNIIFVLSMGCQWTTDAGKGNEKAGNRQTIKDATSEPVALFENQMPFEIMQWNIGMKKAGATPDTSICSGWNLSTSEMEKIMASGRPIDPHIWHYKFSVLPCFVEGVIRQNNQVYGFSINAGSWFAIHTEDTAFYYGIYQKEVQKYFLEPVEGMN